MTEAVETVTAKPKRRRRVAIVAAIVGGVVGASLVAALVVLPRIIATEARAAARDRGLELELKSVSLSTRGADVHEVRVRPLGDPDRGSLVADAIEVQLSGARVDRVRARSAKVDLRGDADEVLKAFVPPQPTQPPPTTPGPKPPIVEADGSVRWTHFAGEESAVAFDVGDFEWDLATNQLRARFTKGQLDVGALHLSPFDIVVASNATEGFTAKIHHSPTPAEQIDLFFHRDPTLDRVELDLAALKIGRWLPSPAGLRLGDTLLDGKLRFDRPDDPKKPTSLKLAFHADGFKLPPVKVTPLFSLPLPGEARITLEAESRPSAPTKLVIDRGRLEGTVFKLTRGVDLRGTIDVGSRDAPTLVFALTWKSDAISCGDLASLTGAGVAAKAVTGVVYAEGRIDWDATKAAKPKVTAALKQTCDVDGFAAVDAATRMMAGVLGN